MYASEIFVLPNIAYLISTTTLNPKIVFGLAVEPSEVEQLCFWALPSFTLRFALMGHKLARPEWSYFQKSM